MARNKNPEPDPPDEEDLAALQSIRDQQDAAAEWERQNPDPQR